MYRVDDVRIHRLLVEDEAGERHALLTIPGNTGLLDVETGQILRFTGLVRSDPVGPNGDDTLDCPDCGYTLRPGRAVDAVSRALGVTALQLGIDSPFGVIDDHTTVARVRSDEGGAAIDDWRPMAANRSAGIRPPDYVCDACGRDVAGYELHGGSDPARHHVIENVQESVASPAPTSSPETLGMATGGAKDVTNFRENVAKGHTPQPEAISDEGLFYDYHFETGDGEPTDALFAPRYATGVSDHPLTGAREFYLSVGLDSTLSMADFQRPRLDLVAVLDVSGSMESAFDEYYYDEQGRRQEADVDTATKLEAATQSLCALTEQLHDEDRLGVVLFNHRAHVAKPLREVGRTDMHAIRRHIREVAAGGGTNMEDGFEAALDMLLTEDSDSAVERRAVFMTDMMPNTGATGESELIRAFADAAADGIHTTFVGMGLDANADLADALSGIRGANHYFVHSAAEFERRLGDEFEYMVSPLVFDLGLELKTDDWEIAAVHGSPNADAGTGRLLDVGTLFPSPKQDGEARGGVVLARLKPAHGDEVQDGDLELIASWTERDGSQHRKRVEVVMAADAPTYDHTGIRKAVALARYACELRAWAGEIHDRAGRATGVDDWLLPDARDRHERESVPLVVPEEYVERFDRLRSAMEAELAAIGDPELEQELDLLDTLCETAPARFTEVRE